MISDKSKSKYKLNDLYEDRVYTRTQRNEFGQWETVQTELRYRRPVQNLSTNLRFVHFFIDYILFHSILIFLVMPFPESYSLPLLYLFAMLVYYCAGEFLFQKTLGKVLTKSIVVDEYGEKPDLQTIILRTVIRLIPFEVYSFLSKDCGWHDEWSDTYVIQEKELVTIKNLMTDPRNLKP